MPQCTTGRKGQAMHTRDELPERPHSYFFQNGQEQMAWVGHRFTKVVTDLSLQTVHFPSVQQDDLPLASLALVSLHIKHLERAAAHAPSCLWRKEGCGETLPLVSPAEPLPGAGGLKVSPGRAHWIIPALPATFWLHVTSAPADNKRNGWVLCPWKRT